MCNVNKKYALVSKTSLTVTWQENYVLYIYIVIVFEEKILILTLKAALHAGDTVCAVVGEGVAVSKDETVLLLLQVGEPDAGRGLQTKESANLLSYKVTMDKVIRALIKLSGNIKSIHYF